MHDSENELIMAPNVQIHRLHNSLPGKPKGFTILYYQKGLQITNYNYIFIDAVNLC